MLMIRPLTVHIRNLHENGIQIDTHRLTRTLKRRQRSSLNSLMRLT